MKNWRKMLIFLLAIGFIFNLPLVALAGKPSLEEHGKIHGKMRVDVGDPGPPQVMGHGKMGGRFEIKLKDVQGHWAEDSMVAMNMLGVINGYPDYNFRPNQSVKQAEAIAMIIRMIGLEGQVGTVTIPEIVYTNRHIDEWAKPYLALALQKGIITADEIGDYENSREAMRYQIAIWVARALGLEGQALAAANQALPFTDAQGVPAWARGYVAVITSQGIMVGYPDHVFHPNKGVKRAEMAILLNRMMNHMAGRFHFQVVSGVVQEVYDGNNPSIILFTRGWRNHPLPPVIFHQDDVTQNLDGTVGRDVYGGRIITVKVVGDALIYLDGKRVDLTSLEAGVKAVVFIEQSGEAVFIMARTPDVIIQPLEDKE